MKEAEGSEPYIIRGGHRSWGAAWGIQRDTAYRGSPGYRGYRALRVAWGYGPIAVFGFPTNAEEGLVPLATSSRVLACAP